MWPYILGIVFIIACLFAYLFKAGVLGKAKLKLGAAPYVLELDMQSKARQISDRDFKKVNLEEFYVDSDLGFIVRKPVLEGWTVEKMTVAKMYEEKGFTKQITENVLGIKGVATKDPEEDPPALAITSGKAQTIRYTQGTRVDGALLDSSKVRSLLLRFEEIVYDRVSITAFNKEQSDVKSLLDFFLTVAPFVKGMGPRKLYVNHENTVFLLDCSALFEKIMYNGEHGSHVINNAMLLQENDKNFFGVIVSYVQSDDKPTEVWDELRGYLSSFRVLAK